MYCTKCGSEIPDDAKFCPFCAALTDGSTSPQIQPTSPAQPTPSPYQELPPKSSSSKGVIIAVVLVVLIIGIVLIYSGFQTLTRVPTTGITMLIIGAVIVLCIISIGCGTGSRRGGGGCGGCDGGGGCDCDCGDCAS